MGRGWCEEGCELCTMLSPRRSASPLLSEDAESWSGHVQIEGCGLEEERLGFQWGCSFAGTRTNQEVPRRQVYFRKALTRSQGRADEGGRTEGGGTGARPHLCPLITSAARKGQL